MHQVEAEEDFARGAVGDVGGDDHDEQDQAADADDDVAFAGVERAQCATRAAALFDTYPDGTERLPVRAVPAALLRACTPGAISPAVTQANLASTICRKGGYTGGIRPSASVTGKEKVLNAKSYGYAGSMSDAEFDHLISLQLGGDPNDSRNLWVEPRTLATSRVAA
jgi:hypothetical protein